MTGLVGAAAVRPGYPEPTLLPHLVATFPVEQLPILAGAAAGFGEGRLGMLPWPPLGDAVLHAIADRLGDDAPAFLTVATAVPPLLAWTPQDLVADLLPALLEGVPSGGADDDALRRAELLVRAALLDPALADPAAGALEAVAGWYTVERASLTALLAAGAGAEEADAALEEIPGVRAVSMEALRLLAASASARGHERLGALLRDGGRVAPVAGAFLLPWLEADLADEVVDALPDYLHAAPPPWHATCVLAWVAEALDEGQRELLLTEATAAIDVEPWRRRAAQVLLEPGDPVLGVHPPAEVAALRRLGGEEAARAAGVLLDGVFERWAGAPPAAPEAAPPLEEAPRQAPEAAPPQEPPLEEPEVVRPPEPPDLDRPRLLRPPLDGRGGWDDLLLTPLPPEPQPEGDREPEPPEPEAAEPEPEADAETGAEPGAPPPPGPQPRFANLRFVRDDEQVVPRTLALAAATAYRLRVDIGALDAASLVSNPAAVPQEHLPETPDGHWLRVMAVSTDFTVAPDEAWLFLPLRGAAWTCACPRAEAHACTPAERRAWVDVHVTAPPAPTTARLRLSLYHAANLVQSFVVTAAVAAGEEVAPAATADLDFSLSPDLSSVGSLPGRDMSLLPDTDGGTHRLVLVDGDGASLTVSLGATARGSLARAVRKALLDLHVEQRAGGLFGRSTRLVNRYDEDNAAPSVQRFREDVRALAPVGRRVWNEMFGSVLDDDSLAHRLAGTSGQRLQVATPATSSFVFPWALTYDLPLGSDPARHTDCPVLDDWDLASPSPPSTPDGACPRTADHGQDVVCPFGFWGFRHRIEQPVPAHWRNLDHRVVAGARAATVVGIGTADLIREAATTHLDRVRGMFSWRVADCLDRATLQHALEGEDVAAVYFFCHGVWETDDDGRTVTYLQLEGGDRVAAGDLLAWDQVFGEQHWRTAGPVVFLNGCHTADVTPDSVVDLVTGFARLGAAGVVGTETTVHQQVAAEVAEGFWQATVGDGASVGEALRRVRRALLAKGNLLGLAYTAYCADELAIVRS